MNPALVLFAIEAGVRLGHKLNDALVSSTVERPLLLPLGELYGDIREIEAVEFFDRDENLALTAPGGPYAGYGRDELVKAFKTLKHIDGALGGDDLTAACETVRQLHQFEQIKQGHGAPPALQQILGELVNLGIDYFAANPGSLVRDSSARRIVGALVQQFDSIDFSLEAPPVIINDVLLAALETLRGEHSLLDDNARLQAVVGGVTNAVVEELRRDGSPGAQVRRAELARRVLSAALLGSAEALRSESPLFPPAGSAARPLIDAALTQVLRGIEGDAELFSSAAVGQLVRSVIAAVDENAELFASRALAQRMIRSVTAALTTPESSRYFDPSLVPVLVDTALRIAVRHAGMCVQEDDDVAEIMARAIGAVSAGLSAAAMDGGPARARWPKQQLTELATIALHEAARRPLQTLGSSTDPGEAALAQILGSAMLALDEAPLRLMTGDDRLELMRLALGIGLRDSGRLLDRADLSLRANPLYRCLSQIVQGIAAVPAAAGCDGPGLLVDVARRLLPLAAANMAALADDGSALKDAIARSAALAYGSLDGRINSANFPLVLEGIVRQLLWQELDLSDDTALLHCATAILRTAREAQGGALPGARLIAVSTRA